MRRIIARHCNRLFAQRRMASKIEVENSHLVFVYGTLKTDEPNHSVMTTKDTGSHELVGVAKTVEKYPLVIASQYNIPFLLDRPKVGDHIVGEIYKVNDDKLNALDILENHPNFYVRRLEEMRMTERDETLQCWTYFLPTFRTSLLELRMMNEYSSKGEHGLVYVNKYLRSTYSPVAYIRGEADKDC